MLTRNERSSGDVAAIMAELGRKARAAARPLHAPALMAAIPAGTFLALPAVRTLAPFKHGGVA